VRPQLLSLEEGVGDLRQRSALLTKARAAPRGRLAVAPGAGTLQRALTALCFLAGGAQVPRRA
jgi:hypothetical protein